MLLAAHVSYAATVRGTVDPGKAYLISGMPVASKTATVLKFVFENKTENTSLSLCAGTAKDFSAGTCAMNLVTSGGPGFQFLSIVDSTQLTGKLLFVVNTEGSVKSDFVLTVE